MKIIREVDNRNTSISGSSSWLWKNGCDGVEIVQHSLQKNINFCSNNNAGGIFFRAYFWCNVRVHFWFNQSWGKIPVVLCFMW